MEITLNEHCQKVYRNFFWPVLIGITLFRLAFAGRFGLGVDESHYVMYSRHLAWGYFDHPPMVAFLAALTSTVGDSPFFIRLGPIICSTFSLILLRHLALALYRDERISFWALIVLHLMPYQHLLMVGLLPDATLNLFWCGSLLAVWHAIKTGRWKAWFLVGICFGGALLSKYHAVLLPFCLFGYLLTSPKYRYWLGKLQPYVAVLIGLVVFLPNIFWNARNGWSSYRFQLAHGGGGGVEIGNIFEVFGGQLAAWSPIIFILFFVCLIMLLRQKPLHAADRFAIWTSMPVFIFFCGIGIVGKILPHWPSVAWWTGSLAVVNLVLQKASRKDKSAIRWQRWSVAAAVTGFVMTAVLFSGLFGFIVEPMYIRARSASLRLHQHFPGIQPLEPYKPKYDITNELFGWDQIGKRVEEIRAMMPRPDKTFVFGHRFFTSSQLGIHLHPETVVTVLHHKPNQYRLWFKADAHTGWDALFIDEDRYFKGSDRYRPLFMNVNPKPEIINVCRKTHLAHEIRVYKYYGFKGRYEGG